MSLYDAWLRRSATRKLEIIVALVVVVLDQITKAMVRPALALHDSIEVIPGFLDLTRVHNTGAAFGMLNARGLPVQDGGAVAGGAGRARRRRVVRCHGAARAIGWRASALPACWAARSAT